MKVLHFVDWPALPTTCRGRLVLWATLALLAAAPARLPANVYATNIRLDDRAADRPLYIPCGAVEISYLLNEDATAGVTVDLLAGTNLVRSIVLAAGGPGTLRGRNRVVWDGTDNFGAVVPFGAYRVRITAAAAGYSEWTRISLATGLRDYYAWDPVGIAVNCNPDSPAYGRVFVANASEGPNPDFSPGDRVGLLMFNADGSLLPGAGWSDGGWDWTGNGLSPGKLAVGADDRVYVNDPGSNQVVLRFDANLTAASRQVVLRPDNQPAGGASFSGLAVTGSGAATALWMADAQVPGSTGVRRWQLGVEGRAATNDPGVLVIQAGEGSDLSVAPYDVDVAGDNRICTIQDRTASGDPAARVLCFTNYGWAPLPLTNAAWLAGSGDNAQRGAAGVALDRTGTHVAVAFRGAVVNNFQVGGRTLVFELATGNVVTNILTDLPGGESHDHTDVAWDNAGNLYDLDNYDSTWRVYSPPGSNAAATVAPYVIHVTDPPVAAILEAAGHTNGQFHLTLTGRTNLTYVVEASPDFQQWTPVATNPPAGCASRSLSISAPGARSFYRAWPLLPATPLLQAVACTNSQFTFTLTGQAGASYVILCATNPAAAGPAWSRVTTNTSAEAARTVTLPAPAAAAFYRALLAP